MTRPDELFARYLTQRESIGEVSYVLTHAEPSQGVMPAESPATDTPSTQKSHPPSKGPRTAPEEGSEQNKWRKGAPEIPPPGIEISPPSSDLFASDPLANVDLDKLGELIRRCEQCALSRGRKNAVPGEGPPDADLMVIGEGPGANEDEQGRPFVGRAGDLLNEILAAIGCPRETVYIANIVKCRPPQNRNPETDEIVECLPYLHRQIALVKPKVILAMGGVAACTLLEYRGSLGSLRNKVHTFRGIPLVVTYHPAALLRNPNWKKPTWDDVRIARRLLAGER